MAGLYRDIFHLFKVGPPLFVNLSVTADGFLGDVLDRRDLDDPDGDLVGLILVADAVTTADGTNFIDFEIFEADEKSSPTALISGTKVDDTDILGFTDDGIRSVIPNPDFDATQPETVQAEDVNLQDGFFPRIDATAQAGHSFWFSYRGERDVIQIFANETGTADANVTCVPVFGSMKTRNMVNPA